MRFTTPSLGTSLTVLGLCLSSTSIWANDDDVVPTADESGIAETTEDVAVDTDQSEDSAADHEVGTVDDADEDAVAAAGSADRNSTGSTEPGEIDLLYGTLGAGWFTNGTTGTLISGAQTGLFGQGGFWMFEQGFRADGHEAENFSGLFFGRGSLRANIVGVGANDWTVGAEVDGRFFIGGQLRRPGNDGCGAYFGMGVDINGSVGYQNLSNGASIMAVPETGIACAFNQTFFMFAPGVGIGRSYERYPGFMNIPDDQVQFSRSDILVLSGVGRMVVDERGGLALRIAYQPEVNQGDASSQRLSGNLTATWNLSDNLALDIEGWLNHYDFLLEDIGGAETRGGEPALEAGGGIVVNQTF
jgi:hypothetical protein